MNNFLDYLMSYISFLENTSDEVIETGITKDKERIFDRINEKYLILKKKNKKQLMNQKNNFYKNGCIKYFDIKTKEFTEIEQLALVHLFLEIFLNKRISLKKIFRRNYVIIKYGKKLMIFLMKSILNLKRRVLIMIPQRYCW